MGTGNGGNGYLSSWLRQRKNCSILSLMGFDIKVDAPVLKPTNLGYVLKGR